jgi:hypothetical protein
MNKEYLRNKFLQEIPEQIIKGEQLSYADWLENIIVSEYVINKNDVIGGVRDCCLCGNDFTPSKQLPNNAACKDCHRKLRGY